MPCERVEFPDGKGVAIICSRSGPRKRCSVPGCEAWASKLCDYPTPGPKTPNRTCSKALCERCTAHVGEDRDLCPPHAKLVEAAKVPPSILADPHPHAMSVAKDVVEAQRESVVGAARHTTRPFAARDREDWLEYYNERAAIGEYERGMDRTLAEYQARELAGPPPQPGQQSMRFTKGARYVPDGEQYW
jgi:hypothetical protein